MTERLPDSTMLRDIERTAVDLARLAGAAIESALGRSLAVRYKAGLDAEIEFRDPVSEVDHQVELLIRAHLADKFPRHDVLGEESEERPGRESDFVWAVDPIDGTTNFVNGFPMFAASIGVLHKARPIAGAVWCAATHALRAGVYHAHVGGRLSFDNEQLAPRANPAVRRHLAGEPAQAVSETRMPWEFRTTGSAAMECAFVAAGLMRVARFATPNVWDVAGGVVLVQAAGGKVRVAADGEWAPLQAFDAPARPDGTRDLRYWRSELVLGDPRAVAMLCEARLPHAPRRVRARNSGS